MTRSQSEIVFSSHPINFVHQNLVTFLIPWPSFPVKVHCLHLYCSITRTQFFATMRAKLAVLAICHGASSGYAVESTQKSPHKMVLASGHRSGSARSVQQRVLFHILFCGWCCPFFLSKSCWWVTLLHARMEIYNLILSLYYFQFCIQRRIIMSKTGIEFKAGVTRGPYFSRKQSYCWWWIEFGIRISWI